MSNNYKILLAVCCSIAALICFYAATDCANTANYVHCPSGVSDKFALLFLSSLLICISIFTAGSVNVHGSDKDEN